MEPLLLLVMVAVVGGVLATLLALGAMAFVRAARLERELRLTQLRLNELEAKQVARPLVQAHPAPSFPELEAALAQGAARAEPPAAPLALPKPTVLAPPPETYWQAPTPRGLGDMPVAPGTPRALTFATVGGAALFAAALFASADALLRPDAPGWPWPAWRLAGACALAGLLAAVGVLAPMRAEVREHLGHWTKSAALGWIGAGVFAGLAAGYVAAALAPAQAAPLTWRVAGLAVIALTGAGALLLADGRSRILAATGLAALFAGPAFAGLEREALVYLYLAVVLAGVIVFLRAKTWVGFDIAALAAAGAWIVAAALGSAHAGAAAVFFALFATAVAIGHGWPAGAAMPRGLDWRDPVPAALAMTGLASGVAAVLTTQSGHAAIFIWSGLVLALGVTAASALRARYAPAALAPAAAGVAIVALWPANAAAAPAIAAAAFAAVAAAGAWIIRRRSQAPLAGAALAATGPLGLLVGAHAATDGTGGALGWGAAALAIVAYCSASAIDEEHRRRHTGGVGGATGILAAGAAAAAAVGANLATQGLWLAAGLAVLAATLSWAAQRIAGTVFATAAAACGAAAALLLVTPASIAAFRGIPGPAYALAVAAFAAAVWAYRHAEEPGGRIMRRAFAVAGVAVGATGLAVEVRLLANGGDVAAPFTALGEVGGHSVWLLAGAVALAFIQARGLHRHPFYLPLETAIAAAGAGLAVVGAVGLMNPWWGVAPAAAPGWPLANALAIAFLAPAILLGVYAWLAQGRGLERRAQIAAGAATLLALVWAALEIRRFAQGPDAMTGLAQAPSEMLAHTLLLLAAAAALAAAGRVLWPRLMEWAARAAFGAALLKALAWDAPALPGWERIAAIAIALAAGAALAYGARRFLPAARPPPAEATP